MPTSISFVGFDIETRPQSRERLMLLKPEFKAPSNYKEAAAISKFISQKEEDWFADAALSPFTGAIVVLGLVDETGAVEFLEGSEIAILTEFWIRFTARGQMDRFVFWSGCGSTSKQFDIDFMVTRSRLLSVAVPAFVRRGRFYTDRIVDLAGELLLHQHDAYMRLTVAAQIMGMYEPPFDEESDRLKITPKRDTDLVTGENFWRWYDGVMPADIIAPAEQRAYALGYLRNDLLHLVHLARRIL